jgi:hypothetical protein
MPADGVCINIAGVYFKINHVERKCLHQAENCFAEEAEAVNDVNSLSINTYAFTPFGALF